VPGAPARVALALPQTGVLALGVRLLVATAIDAFANVFRCSESTLSLAYTVTALVTPSTPATSAAASGTLACNATDASLALPVNFTAAGTYRIEVTLGSARRVVLASVMIGASWGRAARATPGGPADDASVVRIGEPVAVPVLLHDAVGSPVPCHCPPNTSCIAADVATAGTLWAPSDISGPAAWSGSLLHFAASDGSGASPALPLRVRCASCAPIYLYRYPSAASAPSVAAWELARATAAPVPLGADGLLDSDEVATLAGPYCDASLELAASWMQAPVGGAAIGPDEWGFAIFEGKAPNQTGHASFDIVWDGNVLDVPADATGLNVMSCL